MEQETVVQPTEPQPDMLAETVTEASETPEDSIESIFNELGGINQTLVETENTQESGINSVASETPPTEVVDDGSYRYWQSEADKRKHERDEAFRVMGVNSLDEFQTKARELQTLAPAARYIVENPDILTNVENKLSGTPNGQPQPGDQQLPQQAAPVPEKPADYDPTDAFNDPDSNSWKYREDMDTFRDSEIKRVADENVTMRNQVSNAYQQLQEKDRQNGIVNELSSTHGMTQQEINDFMAWGNSGESYSISNLVNLFRQKSGAAQQQVPQQTANTEQKVAEFQRQAERLKAPQPVGVVPGTDQVTNRPLEDRIMDLMVNDSNRLTL